MKRQNTPLGESYWRPTGPVFYDEAELSTDTGQTEKPQTPTVIDRRVYADETNPAGDTLRAAVQDVTSDFKDSVRAKVGNLGGLCDSCGSKDAEERKKKRAEIAAKYGLRDCNFFKDDDYFDCIRFNQEQIARRDAEFAEWQRKRDEAIGAALGDKEAKFLELIITLCKKLIAYNAAFGPMRLKDVAKADPIKFHSLYAEVQASYSMFKNIDADTVLTLNPSVAEMTVNEILGRAQSMINGKYGFMGRYTLPLISGSVLFLLFAAWYAKRQK